MHPARTNLHDITVGANLRQARRAAGLDPVTIARLWNRTEHYVALVEAGVLRPSALELFDAAAVIGCRLSDLFARQVTRSRRVQPLP